MSNKDSDDEDNNSLENSNKREQKIKLQEAVYEALGKAWPSSKETQGIGEQEKVQWSFHKLDSVLQIHIFLLQTSTA